MKFSLSIKREIQLIFNDVWLKALLFYLPVILFFMLWAIFSSGLARNLPIGFVDLDQSKISRGLIQYYDASPTLSIQKSYTSVKQASNDLRNGSIYALVVIPSSLEKNTLLGHSPEVTVFYNSQYILVGKLINAAAIQAQSTYTAQLATLKNMLIGTPKLVQALGQAVPVQQQITPLFNSNNHYGQFLTSALIPALWQILIMLTIILVFANENRNKGVISWLGDQPITNIIAKLLPYTLLFWLQGVLFLVALYSVLAWPMHGSWVILIFAQLLLVIACQCVASLFFFITFDAARAMSLVAGFAAPAFAFMGITFPVTDMQTPALIWRALLPISHYIEIQEQQVNYGTNILSSANNLAILLSFVCTLFIAVYFAKKKQAKSQTVKSCNEKSVTGIEL